MLFQVEKLELLEAAHGDTFHKQMHLPGKAAATDAEGSSACRLGEIKTFCPVLIRDLNCDLGAWDPEEKL